MKIDVNIIEPATPGFATVTLVRDGNASNAVELSIDFRSLYAFSKDTSSIRFDFFLFSTIVYGVDNLVSRGEHSLDGWSREIEITFPVCNLSAWKGTEARIQDLLKFLTGDHWAVRFQKLAIKTLFLEKKKFAFFDGSKKDITAVSLFSGGLDSFIGVIDIIKALKKHQSIALISHFDSNSVGANTDQQTLLEEINKEYPDKAYWFQEKITLSRTNVIGKKLILESSYRSRSILFIGIALLMFDGNTKATQLVVPENGTISLNYPLTPSRGSTLSTRTTHPHYLNMLRALLQSLKIEVDILNPYGMMTKGEMMTGCADPAFLKKTFQYSVSCGKRGHREHWNIKSGTNHCGVCMPCIYRRAALYKGGSDIQLYGNDVLKADNINDFMDMPALFDFLKTRLSREEIKRNLLVNGSLPLDQLSHYGEVVERSRSELRKWLSDKGNSYIKGQLK